MKMVCKPGDREYIMPGSPEYCDVIGCSQIAAIRGQVYGENRLDVWKEKTHRKPKKEHKRIFDRGHRMEAEMARMIQDQYGRLLKSEQVQYRDPDRPWLIFHADGMFPKHTPLVAGGEIYEGQGLWEAKAPGMRMTDTMSREGISEHYLIQGQMGMHVAGCALGIPIQWGTFGYLDYDEWDLVAIDVKASWDFQRQTLELLDEFWDCVVRDVPPEPINPASLAPVPDLPDRPLLVDEGDLYQLAEELRMLQPALKQATDRDKFIRDQLKKAWDDQQEIVLPGVGKFTYRHSKPSEKVDGEGLLAYCEWLIDRYNEVATDQHWLDKNPDSSPIIFDRTQWVEPVPPRRIFRPTWEKE